MGEHFRILHGNSLDVLATLPAASVQVCVTSPPYYGLRDYGTERIEWPEVKYSMFGHEVLVPACRASLGLEETPEAFVGHMVAIFREVRRVLKSDGTCWVNMGDSYAGSWGSQGRQGHGAVAGRSAVAARQIAAAAKRSTGAGRSNGAGVKPKDLYGMPWWLAFALREDGWWLRQDIIWHKPTPMQESIRDRCTKAHEYVFLLAKSARYYFDQAAVREPATALKPAGNKTHKGATAYANGDARHRTKEGLVKYAQKAKVPSGWDTGPGDHRKMVGRYANAGSGGEVIAAEHDERNKRSVWTIPTQATPEAHFATYPVDLPEIAILAGSRPGDTVLDLFNGAGTTGLAALKNGREYVGVELSQAYIDLAMERARRIYPLLVPPAVEVVPA